MDNTDSLLGGLASGDSTGPPKIQKEPELKREQDSVDDFEHLDREGPKRDDFHDSPVHGAARTATQSFLDTEREELFVQPSHVAAPIGDSFPEKYSDHIADKFTDSESESAGESPMHRPDPRPEPLAPVAELLNPSAPTPELVSFADDPKPTAVTAPAPELKPEPVKPSSPPALEPKEAAPAPKIEPAPAPKVDPPSAPKAEPTPPPKVEPTPPPKVEPAPKSQAKPESTAELVGRAPTAHVIEAEVIFCQMGLDAWFDPQRLHPKVESLIYWRDPARSGAALAAGLVLLIALACCSVVSVLAYASLLALSGAVAFRIYRNVLQAVQKTNEGHPFKALLEKDISVPAERAQSHAAAATAHLNATVNELRRLFLVEDLVDSLKFGVLLWCLTYVGAFFNGITLIILGWIALFTLPKAYEMNKAQVDANLELARGKINEISAKVRAAVPLGRKAESEKDK